jgi:hypothetical protein
MLDASMRSTHCGLYDLSISLQHTVFDCYPEELPNARESWRAWNMESEDATRDNVSSVPLARAPCAISGGISDQVYMAHRKSDDFLTVSCR